MVEHAILTSRDKQILAGEYDPEDIDNFENRIYKIRWRVRTRCSSLIEELELLRNEGEADIVSEFLNEFAKNVDGLEEGNLVDRVERLHRDIEEVERSCENIPELKERLQEVEQELGL